MEVRFAPAADEDFQSFDKQLQLFFNQHIEKLIDMPPRKKHLRHGIPFHKEDVTKQARLVYDIDGEIFIVIRCFATHKEYEKWYKTYKN
jgi:mRNA-degrading endonuclease RelE of RelBE toxin-antitoxin system